MTAYYNEIDPKAAAWLRELIKQGHIAPGEVDERSILEVRPDDLRGFTQCHFFAGIGGWSAALRRAGWVDDRPVWTGSCPCQPFSVAGKGEGHEDERHLWPAFFGLIREQGPVVVFGEQVADGDGYAWIDDVGDDLEGIAYTVGAVCPASCGFGSPDERQRMYWVAHAERGGRQQFAVDRSSSIVAGADGQKLLLESCHRRASPSGLANANGERLDGIGIHLLERGSRQAVPQAAGRSEAGRVADADDARREGRRRVSKRAAERAVGPRGVARGLAESMHTIGRSLSEYGEDGRDRQDGGREEARGDAGARSEVCERPGPLNGFWRAADWLLCTDGKWRPVEPGTFPLADGLPARLGRLRGYGNAINLEVAAAFIRAFREVTE